MSFTKNIYRINSSIVNFNLILKRSIQCKSLTTKSLLWKSNNSITKIFQCSRNVSNLPNLTPAGALLQDDTIERHHIPQVALNKKDERKRKRVLVLCTGGTLTMGKDPDKENALRPIEGMLSSYMSNMTEFQQQDDMPQVYVHEYTPLIDSSDMCPADWSILAQDLFDNYYYYDGFVVCMGTDTMAYAASALSFMLENLNKPVIFTGSQIPLSEPYNDARRNLIMSIIFASRDSINEVAIFFHDTLLRACRATKINTNALCAFDTPNLPPLAKVGITITESNNINLPMPHGRLRVHTNLETRILSLRLIPGFDDSMIHNLISSSSNNQNLKALVLQLYGTGNLPSRKDTFINTVQRAVDNDILVVAGTQCMRGNVMLGQYLTGQALKKIGVATAADMTLEATCSKLSYLFGRGDLTKEEIAHLMPISLRGEVTPSQHMPLSPF